MFIPIIIGLLLLGVGGLQIAAPDVAETLTNYGAEAVDTAHAVVLEYYIALRNWVIYTILFAGVYVGLFLFLTSVGLEVWAMIMLFAAMLPILAVSYVMFQVQGLLREVNDETDLDKKTAAAKRLREWGKRVSFLPAVISPRFTRDRWYKKAGFGVAHVVLLPLNAAYLPLIGLPLTATATMLNLAGFILDTSADVFRYIARLTAFIWLWLGAAAFVMLFDIQTGLGLVDYFTVLVTAIGGLLIYFATQVICDWRLPRFGMFLTAAIPLTVMITLCCITTLAHVDPDLASGLAQPVVIAHDNAVSYLHGWAANAKSPRSKKYIVKAKILQTYVKRGATFVPAETGTAEQPVYKVNDKGFMAGGYAAPRWDVSAGDKMVLVGPPIKTEADSVKHVDDFPDQLRWVKYSSIQEVKDDAEQATADAEPDTPAGWKEVSRGQVDVSKPFTPIGKAQGKTLVIMWGKATVDHTQKPLGPEGEHKQYGASSDYPLPGVTYFCAVLREGNGTLSYVGPSREFNFPDATDLSIGPNDNPQGMWDNEGEWNYKVCVPNS